MKQTAVEHKLILIDGHALAYQMFFALPLANFTTKAGEPTNATYGFTRALFDLLFAPHPSRYLAVSFDLGGTFRDALYEPYKGTRDKMPDELALQIERIKQVVRALNIPIFEMEGFEADDLLGTMARQAKAFDVPVHIITGDRDLLQLVDENTQVELPARGKSEKQVFDVTAVTAKYGIPPNSIVDWKALVGDTSDNIPGVLGVGEKTATKLLQEYGTLDNIYAHLDEIKGALQKKLADGKESAYLSQTLSRIVTDAPITLDLEACVAHDFDNQPVDELFAILEFRSLRNDLAQKHAAQSAPNDQPTTPPVQTTRTITVQTAAQLKALVEVLNQATAVAIDVETTGLDATRAELVGICLAVQPPVSYYIPVGHLAAPAQAESGQMALFATTPTLAEGQLPLPIVLNALRPALTNPAIPKITHNGKYDYAIMARYGIPFSPITFDTMIAEWLTDPASKFKGLKDLAEHRLGIKMTNIEELIGKGKKQISFAELPIEEAAPYGAADADMTLRLLEPLQAEIQKKNLEKILALETPLIPVLASMEQAGITVDIPFLRHMSQDFAARLLQLEQKIHALAGETFNINSTQQLSDLLFKKLHIPHEGLKKTASGHFSTSADVLEELVVLDPTGIIALILEYREIAKLKSTYVDALPEMVNPQTGRVHTNYNQTGAITGRIASNAPNLQNIPIRTEIGQQIRRAFVAQPGFVLLSADYSQVELRILAHVCQDVALLEAFRQDQDIHRTTAATVYGIPVDAVTYEQRRFAKAVNFGLIYGMGAFRLSRDAGITLAEAENYIKAYFERFPGIQKYLDETKQKARQDGFVETLMGRRRYFPVFKSSAGNSNYQLQLRAEREAINHPIQGTAADMMKIAMLNLYEALAGKKTRMILQVHDELVLEVPEAEVTAVLPLTIDIMSHAYPLDIPLKVSASTGQNWLELKG